MKKTQSIFIFSLAFVVVALIFMAFRYFFVPVKLTSAQNQKIWQEQQNQPLGWDIDIKIDGLNPPEGSPYTRVKYRKLKSRMTKNAVISVLGMPTKIINKSHTVPSRETAAWMNSDGKTGVEVYFVEDQLYSKKGLGL